MSKKWVQYGCGLSAPAEWINFDISPTLRIQKIPLIGNLLKGQLNTVFPSNVLYGDIIKGLPVEAGSCDALYCSHTLEHLSLEDFRTALKNSYQLLKKGGIFRCVVPDLEYCARSYINSLDSGDNMASLQFIGKDTLLGIKKRPYGLRGLAATFLGNSHHLWMWDKRSLGEELKNAGFSQVRVCEFNDSQEEAFKLVEDKGRFINAAALEAIK